MNGTRRDPRRYENDGGYESLNPGEFGLMGGNWYGCTPNGHGANLSAHDVVEHKDGLITVSPSILVGDRSGPLWHGYLEHGVWREC